MVLFYYTLNSLIGILKHKDKHMEKHKDIYIRNSDTLNIKVVYCILS